MSTLEIRARRQLPANHLDKADIVPLQDAKEGRNIAAVIVNHFRFRPLCAAQKYSAHAAKRLGIASMIDAIDPRDNSISQPAFAAQPRSDRIHRPYRGLLMCHFMSYSAPAHRWVAGWPELAGFGRA